jgi:LysM repeat protein
LLAQKLKRSLWFALASSGASLLFLAPALVSASVFSIPAILSSFTKEIEAAGGNQNSQTVSLLSPATNIDPSGATGGGDITLVGGTALLSEEGPSGTAADIAGDTSSAIISVYTVHKGDTLGGIAKMYGVTVNTIVWANNTSVIHEGDQLIILPITGVRYTIIKGDTVAGIAKKYKADANEIAQYNDLALDSPLTAGDTILIPNGEVPPTAAQVAQSAHSSAIKRILKGATEPFLGGSGPDIGSYFSWPVQGGVITQGLHGWNAVDIGAPKGNAIYAAAAGTVIIAKSNGAWNGGYGNYVVISHSNGTQTLYAHMSKVLTSVGAQVSQGNTIGKVGATGEATGPHLHFEVRGAVNPFAN